MGLPGWAALFIAGAILLLIGTSTDDGGVLTLLGTILVIVGAVLLTVDVVGRRRL